MKNHKDQEFVLTDAVPAEELGGGVRRSVLVYSDDIMVCRLHFDKGAVGTVHSHPHTQITYILSGRFEFTVGGERRIVTSGDSILDLPDVEHGCVCIEEGELLDVFSPMRESFVI